MKKTFRMAVSMLLVLVMALSVCLVPAFAATGVRTSKNQYNTYLVIGDSIAAGYGLNCQEDDPYTWGNQMAVHHGEIVPNSYASLVSKATGSNVINSARESFTASVYLRMLDPEYEEWICQPENYYDRFLSEVAYFTPKAFMGTDDIPELQENMVQYVKEADVITINLGNNDIVTNSMMDAMYRTLYYAFGMEMQPVMTALRGEFQMIDSLTDLFSMVGSYQLYSSAVETNTKKYKQNYERLIKRIYELNPAVELYYLGMYNSFAEVEPQDDAIVSWLRTDGDRLAKELKTFVTKQSKYRNKVNFVDVSDAEVWPTDTVYSPQFMMAFVLHSHPDFNGHRYIANQIIASMNKNGKGNSMPSLTKKNGTWGVYNKDGSLRSTYIGLAKKSNGTVYYIRNGKIAGSYSGIISWHSKQYYIKSGRWRSDYSGTISTSSKKYTIKDGIVVKTTSK